MNSDTWRRGRHLASSVLVVLALASVATESASPVEAAATAPDPISYYRDLRRARDLFARRSWAEAARLFESLVEKNAVDGGLWRDLGDCRYEQRQYLPAAEAYEKALALGFDVPRDGTYMIACCHALTGDKEKAFAWLEKSLAAAFEERPDIGTDERLASLRDDARFPALVGRIDARLDRLTGWKSDLAFLVKEVKRLHDKYRRQPLPPEFERGLEDLESRIARCSDERMAVEIQKLLALIGDGHTVLYPIPARLGTLKKLPIRFHAFSDGVFVIDACDELSRWIGSRVRKVGETDVDEALRRLEPVVSRDNAMGVRWLAPFYLGFPDVLEAVGLIERAPRVPILFSTREGRSETVVLEATSPMERPSLPKLLPSKLPGAPPPPRYLARIDDHFWFEPFDEEDSTLYFQFNHVNDTPQETLARFLTRLSRFLDDTSVRALVLDMRHNEGGNGHLASIVARAMVRFESAGEDRRLFVLTSRNTFSAAQMVINDIDRLTNAVFVGEPSSSSPNFTGEDTTLLLPFSGLRGSISSRSHQTDADDHRVWIAPDVPVELCSEDYFSNRDPALDAVLAIIRQPIR